MTSPQPPWSFSSSSTRPHEPGAGTVLTLLTRRTDLADPLLADLTGPQQDAVTHAAGPLLIVAGAGTGKTTVITRRIAHLIRTGCKPDEILALTFTDKAAAEMEARVDCLVPYGYTDSWISTFHAFGDRLIRDHALLLGRSPQARLFSRAEQLVFLREHLFELPLARFRPLHDPTRYLEALATLMARAKDEAVSSQEFLTLAATLTHEATSCPDDAQMADQAAQAEELAACYDAYQRLLQAADAVDFGDQILLAIQLLEQYPDLLQAYRARFRYVLVDEFQDTNFAQFRLLQLLAPPHANVTVVADDDQSIYKWRGAALSNVIKFLEQYPGSRRIVLTHNFRSGQPLLDAAYHLIRHNDPDRLEVREHIDKRLVAASGSSDQPPQVRVFDTVSSEADWVATQIQAQMQSGRRTAGDFAILVRSNREADPFLRALNVSGVPWRFSGASGLFAHEETKMLLSCLKVLADPEDTLSWYHVLSSGLYECPMPDLVSCLAAAERTHQSLRSILVASVANDPHSPQLSQSGRAIAHRLLEDVQQLLELSRTRSPGQLLYRWLTDTGWLKRAANPEQESSLAALAVVARWFEQLRRMEELVGNRLPELMRSLELFRALGTEANEDAEGPADDRVQVLTLHKAKGLEFSVVFLVGLVQGRFPTPLRRDAIELPEALIKDLLPLGDYHLQEERRLFYVGMTRAKDELYLTAATSYGGRSIRKISQFALEALNLSSPPAVLQPPSAMDRLARGHQEPASAQLQTPAMPEPLRLSPHGADDYLTCPLKFRYSHLLRVPIMRHHLVIYGAALHKAIEQFFKRQLAGQPMTTEDELLAVFEQAWSSEGFLTREHETRRLAQGRQTLRRFFAQQRTTPEHPTLIEEKFSVSLDDFLVVGRWDRVDRIGEDAVIIDYKSSDVTEQAVADKRVRDSLQMGVYALAWRMIHGRLPVRLELRFLETGLIGQAAYTEEDLLAVATRLREAVGGIRLRQFPAKPQEFSCHWCAYQAICPKAFVRT